MHVCVFMHSIFENNKGDHNTNATLTDKEVSSSADIQVVSPNLDIETIIDTCQVDVNVDDSCFVNLNCVNNTSSDINCESLTETGDNVDTTLDTIMVIPAAEIIPAESSNRKLENDSNISDNTAQDNLNQMSILQCAESNAVLSPRRSLMDVVKAHYHKVLLVLTVCCIITLCAMPVILYYVNQIRENATMDLEYSHGKDISTKVCHACITLRS